MVAMVKKTLIIGLVALLLGSFGVFFGASDQFQAQAGEPKTFTLEWSKVLSATTKSSVVHIELGDPGSSDYVTVLTSFPQVFTMNIGDGTVVSASSRIRTSTFPVADQFVATSRDGKFVAWLDLQRTGARLFVSDVDSSGIFADTLDYTANPVPTIIEISENGQWIVIGDRNGIVAVYKQN